MGSVIKLALGNFEVDWGKNEFFLSHLPLYQASDLIEIEVERENIRGLKSIDKTKVLHKPLRDVMQRLRLLGHTLASAAAEYDELRQNFERGKDLGFDKLLRAIKKLDVTRVSAEYSDDHSFGEFFYEEIETRLN